MTRAIADLLGMDDLEQTRRMACAIIANDMIFHERISGMRKSVKPLSLVCGPGVADPKESTLNALLLFANDGIRIRDSSDGEGEPNVQGNHVAFAHIYSSYAVPARAMRLPNTSE